MSLTAYNPALVPPPYGLMNTGVICYFNALLQGLASCPSLVERALENRELMARTKTGAAFYKYMEDVRRAAADPTFRVDDRHAMTLLGELVQELRTRRPGVQFGGGMESAMEGMVFLFEMMEPPSPPAAKPGDSEERISTVEAAATEGQKTHPVFQLFDMKVRDRVWCRVCQAAGEAHQGITSLRIDRQYQYYFFDYDNWREKETGKPVSTPEEFRDLLLKNIQYLEDFKCEFCKKAGRPELPGGQMCSTCRRGDYAHCQKEGRRCEEERTNILRVYDVRFVPTVLVILFNQYQEHKHRYFPEEFKIPGVKGQSYKYKLVAQLEHSGSLHSGHYWARCIRNQDGELRPFALNDSGVGAAALGPAASVYALFYHYAGTD